MKIDLLLPDLTSYDVLKEFTWAFSKALTKQGVKARVIDLNQRASVQQHLKDSPDYTFAFNGLLPDVSNKFLYDFTKVPHITWLVDSPAQFEELLRHPKSLIITIDEEHAEIARKSHPHVLFLPHAVDATRRYTLNRKRKFPLILPGSWTNSIHSKPDTLAREEALKALQGMPLVLFGNNSENRGFTSRGAKSWNTMLSIFEETSLILSITPKIKSGGHERVFEAIAAGAYPLSTPNRYLEQEFAEGGIHFYNPSTLREEVEELLAHPESYQAKLAKGRETLFQRHTWDHRAQALLSHLTSNPIS